MVKGDVVSPKHRYKRRVQDKGNGSDDSDEDYVVSDEENEVSAGMDEEEFYSSVDEDALESNDRFWDYEDEDESKVKSKATTVGRPKKPYGKIKDEDEDDDYVEDEDEEDDDDDDVDDEDDEDKDYDEGVEMEEVKTKGRSKARGIVLKNGVKPSQKRRRVGYREEEDDDDEEFTPSNDDEVEDDDDDDDFTADEDDSPDEEELRVKRKKMNSTAGKRVSRKKMVRSRKRRKKSVASKKSVRKKARKACGFRRKGRSADDDADFIENRLVLRERGDKKRAPKKRRFVVDSDSDFAPSASNEFEYTISEEEREQVREAKAFCRLRTDLRSSSMPEKSQDDLVLPPERKPKGRKGKEKVEEEVKAEIAKKVCGICLSEEDKRRARGTINCCEHYFCFTCISEWAKVESRCPLCKQRFKSISKRSRSSTTVDPVVTVDVPERDQVYQPTEEELRSYLYPYEDVICSECHQGGHDDLMLLCDECDSSAHTYCVGLGNDVPEGSWYCRDCNHNGEPLSPSSPAQTHLSDQRTVNNASTNRPSAVVNNAGGERFDLNSVSLQGLGGLPSPRNQFGGFQSTMAGASASTLSGRIRLRHQIHHCLSERPERSEQNFLNFQPDPDRETPTQHENAPFLEARICENHLPVMQETNLLSPSFNHLGRGGTGTDSNPSPAIPRLAAGPIWPGSGGVNNGYVRQEVDFNAAKEQVQLMVKTHLMNLPRGIDLAQSKLEEIAKCSTQTILVACELEHRSIDVPALPLPPACDHRTDLMRVTKPSLMRGCCVSCFESFVLDVVKKILEAKVSEEHKWLCLALAL